MNNLQSLNQLGQSIWLDFIQRELMKSGKLQSLIEQGVRGLTSNPSIFEKAIIGSTDYDNLLNRLIKDGKSTEEIYNTLTQEDIKQAADILLPIYEQTNRLDGYVSLEVNPKFAYDTNLTLAEAHALWAKVNRPNLMIKIPATKEGLSAITAAITAGINVNVTLIFSIKRYMEVSEAYLLGLEQRLSSGLAINNISSVASFFVSRLDTKIDSLLNIIIEGDNKHKDQAKKLLGKSAVANAKIAYSRFQEIIEGEQFKELKSHGANIQRPLWASTSTKNPQYSDILYVQELIGKNTVNTLPLKTMNAFLDHGNPKITIDQDLEKAQAVLGSLTKIGIDLEAVTQELENEGVKAFEDAFDKLLNSIEKKRANA
jgi:transaldolase